MKERRLLLSATWWKPHICICMCICIYNCIHPCIYICICIYQIARAALERHLVRGAHILWCARASKGGASKSQITQPLPKMGTQISPLHADSPNLSTSAEWVWWFTEPLSSKEVLPQVWLILNWSLSQRKWTDVCLINIVSDDGQPMGHYCFFSSFFLFLI